MEPREPLHRTLDLLGDQWTLLILQSVFLRVRRYSDIQARLHISPAALSGRLAEAVREGVLTKAPYRDRHRTRHEYRLTEDGLALWSLLISIWTWERDWAGDRAAALPDLVHLDCGRSTSAPLGCRNCLRQVELSEVTARRSTEPIPVSAGKRFRRKDSGRLAADPLLFFPATMELLGDRWTTGLLVAAFLGTRHFSEFQRELGIAPSVLSPRLARLVELDVMRTEAATTRTDARAYHLTAKGRAFFPALAFLVDWGARRYPDADPSVVLHHDCGETLDPTPLCEHCEKPLERHRVRVER